MKRLRSFSSHALRRPRALRGRTQRRSRSSRSSATAGSARPAASAGGVFRITDASITGQGYVARRLSPSARTALLRAIEKLNLSYLRAHPFKGTCPTAYDGQESIYRFRGFLRALPSCTYDLSGVAAVRQTERLLATLKPR